MGLFIVNIHGDIEGDYEIIKQISSADVRENIHGTWIGFDYPYIGNQCSVCRSCFKQSGNDYNFCPHCGADMRGEAYE